MYKVIPISQVANWKKKMADRRKLENGWQKDKYVDLREVEPHTYTMYSLRRSVSAKNVFREFVEDKAYWTLEQ
jgi:hypothetical protein